jgi:tetratricopeptide (TPR) repeat protein
VRRGRFVLLGLIVVSVVSWGVIRYLNTLDPRFVAVSAPGIKALASYLIGDYRGASRAYWVHLRSLLGNDGRSVDPAWAAFVNGDLASARVLAEARLAKTEDDDALLTLGEVALAAGHPSEAVPLFERVLSRQTDHFDAGLLASVAFARLGAYDKAITMLTRILRHDRVERRQTAFLSALEAVGSLTALPVTERPHCLLAHYHRYLRIFDPSQGAIAIRYGRTAIAAGDHADAAHVTIGVVYTKQGKWEKALGEYLAATRANAQNPEALSRAAIAYSRLGDVVNEARMRRAAAELAPDDRYYARWFHWVLVNKLGDYRQALILFEHALKDRPTDPDLWYQVGEVQRLLGDDVRSMEAYRRASVLDPNNHAAFVMLGWAHQRAGDPARALALFERAVALSPGAGESYFGVGAAHHALKHYPEAITAYERSFALRAPEDADHLVALCDLYYETSAFELAERCLTHALRIDPQHVRAQRRLFDVTENLRLPRAAR